jgi:hypothetical protein
MTSPVAPPDTVGLPAEATEGGPGAGTVAAVLTAAEVAITTYVLAAYTKWLAAVSTAVLGGFLRFGISPDPSAIWSTVPLWEREVDGLLDRLALIARAGWIDACRQLGVDVPYKRDDPILVDQLLRTRNLMVRTVDEVYRQVIHALGESVAAGGTTKDQVQRVRHVLDVTGTENWPSRARTVATTEVHRAYNFGALAAAMRIQQNQMSPLNKSWDAREDSATRPAHARADGQTRPVNQPFIVNMEPLMMPGDPAGSPSNVINCVPGSARISAVGIEKGFRYSYSGRMLSITRKHGGVSAVSPNHPVLTERGWVPARHLKEGDNLVCAGDLLPPLIIDPDVKRAPTIAQQVYETLMLSGLCERVVGMPMDFHGDGMNGDIDVVFIDGELCFGIDPAAAKFFEKLCLTSSYAPDGSGGTFDQLFMGPFDSANGIMGFDDLIGSLLRAHELPLEQLGFMAPPDRDAQAPEPGYQSGATDGSLIGHALQGVPGKVFLDEVIEIRDFFFEGHLFTFETQSGVYVADGIVSHNCRCKPQFSRSRR